MKVALNLITTNNEPYLKDCLESVKKIKPEYTIVYNGKENSEELELCKQYTKNIIIQEWKENFSELRNVAIENTKSPWILWLDSDEVIEDVEMIKNINQMNSYHSFKLIHGSTTVSQLRLFRNDPRIKWKYPVHEKIVPSNLPDWYPDIKIIHKVNNIQRSSARNIGILLKELDKDPVNADYNFYLAIEYHLLGQQMKALLYAEKFLLHCTIQEVNVRKMYIRYLISWIYTFHLRNYQKAIQIILGQIALNCNIAEFWCLLGDIYLKLGKYDHAYRFYENAIIMGKYKHEHMWITDLDRYDNYPRFRMEQCKKKSGVDLRQIALENKKPIMPE